MLKKHCTLIFKDDILYLLNVNDHIQTNRKLNKNVKSNIVLY
jgi:hypothetical protein